MKVTIVSLLLAVFTSASFIKPGIPEYNTAYGYLTRFGIPEAGRIQKAEDIHLKNSSSRIYNGVPAKLGQFNYLAGLIGEFDETNNRSVCGAVLVSENRVLTAAHCWNDGVNQVSRVTVVLGSTLLFSGGVRIQSNDVVVHPRWFPWLIRNDIAVIRLPSTISNLEIIKAIALPTGSLVNDNFVGEKAIASGFGLTGDGDIITDKQFSRYGTMTVLDNKKCLLAFPFLFRSSNICTNTTGKSSTCRGDSGGPLVVERNGEPVLIGLTSFGFTKCENGFPAAFVRITSYIDFIEANI